MGFEHPTEVQSYLPKLLRDRGNFVFQSYSGSGKRIAMGILMLTNVKAAKKFPHILCVVGSLEAAWQTREAVAEIGSKLFFTVHSAVHGVNGDYIIYNDLHFIHSNSL